MSPGDELRQLRSRLGYTQEELASTLDYSREQVSRWERGKTRLKKPILELVRNMANQQTRKSDASPGFTFIDLFAGIGGMRRGFESVGGRCVFTSEIDRFCLETYQANYSTDHPVEGDIRETPLADIPAHDLLLAGFPCQPFSIAGVSKKNSLGQAHGFEDRTQGTLFFHIAKILEFHRPASFLLENVKHLKNHDGGKTFRVILETLRDELGYDVHVKVIDAQGFVPQHRERIFLAGFREESDFRWEDVEVPDPDDGPTLSSILHPEDGSEPPEPPYTEGESARVVEKYTLSDRLWQYLQDYKEKHRKRGNGFGYGLVDGDDVARTMSARYHKDGSEILIDQGEDKNPRRLTPREAARLMGFDDPDGVSFRIPVSDTQAYQQFGNAVVVPVVETIASGMKPHIEQLADTNPQLDIPGLAVA